MRLLLGLCAVTFFTIAADRALAVGRAPGGTLKWLGWGYGHGYHAPIAHAYPPLSRAIHHAPGGHFLGPHHPGHCPWHGGGCQPMGYGPCVVPFSPYAVPIGPDAASPDQPVEIVPEAPDVRESLPEAPVPPPLQPR